MIIAELLGVVEDTNKNLQVWVAFSRNGVDYPYWRGGVRQYHNGRDAWYLTLAYKHIIGKTPAQRLQFLKTAVEQQIDNIIKEVAAKDVLIAEVKTQLMALVGQTIQKETSVIQIDLNNDKVVDATLTIKDDGTYTVVAI